MVRFKHIILVPFMIPFFYGFGKEFMKLIIQIKFSDKLISGFLLAFIVSLSLSYFLIRQSSYFSILKHELTHNFFALLTFNKPHSLVVERGKGGQFSHLGNQNVLITLSPYFFPLLTFLWMPISLLLLKNSITYISILGALFGFDVSTSLKDLHLQQTDIKHFGVLFSLTFILLAILIFWGMAISFVPHGFTGIEKYLASSLSNIVYCLKKVVKHN